MRLPFSDAQHHALFALLDRLEALRCRSVLVGGLVPPLLRGVLAPGAFEEDLNPRRTADCDVAVNVTVGDSGRQQLVAIEQALTNLAWSRQARINQFRWHHRDGVHLDLVPVPTGIETGAAAAVDLARGLLGSDRDPLSFYRGCELALEDVVEIDLVLEQSIEPPVRRIAVAGFTPMLAMKMQAWRDRPSQRVRDAHDIAWHVRWIPASVAASELVRIAPRWPVLVTMVIEGLRRSFADRWAPGVLAYASQAFPHRYDDDATEGDRNAVVAAVHRLLDELPTI